MDVKTLVLFAFHVAIAGTVFSYGLQATRDDVLYLAIRPGLLFRSLLAVLVIVPVVVIVCVKLLDLPQPTGVVLVALAISPVPPLLPAREKKAGGATSYGLALLLLLGLGAIVTVPLWVALLDLVFAQPLAMRPDAIVKIVLTMVVAPLVAGLLFSKLAPRGARALLVPVRRVANGLLAAGVLALLAGTWRAIWSVTGHGTVLAIIAFVLLGLFVGHMLGGPAREHASVLALSTASRHPAIAMAVASANYPGEQFAPTLILYLILCAGVALPYVKWQRRRARSVPDFP